MYTTGTKKMLNMLISVHCNVNAMYYWALQYGTYVEVHEPVALREKIAETVENMNMRYGGK